MVPHFLQQFLYTLQVRGAGNVVIYLQHKLYMQHDELDKGFISKAGYLGGQKLI